MAKEFDEAVKQITDLRLVKTGITRSIYTEKQAMISNQYLLQAAINHNQDGSKFQENINNHREKINSLNKDFVVVARDESNLVTQLQETFGGNENLVNQMNDRYPILFFPVRIETAFSEPGARELWVRIFPDDIAVDTHEQDLTQNEIDEGMNYWRSFVSADTNEGKVQAWDLLCRSFGAERAAWVALQMQPTNPDLHSTPPPPADQLIFPILNPKPDSWSKQPVSNIMPDAFVIYAYGNDGSFITFQTNNIPDELKMGIDPTLDPNDPLGDPMSFDQQDVAGRSNELVANPNVDWMINFDAAIANGLGAKIQLSDNQFNSGFRKILVLGVKSTLTVTESKTRLEALINSHHYTDGFSLLKQGTSTNNTDTEYSGYSFVEYGNPTTFKTERGDPLFTPVYTQQQKKDGQVLCEALGIEYDLMYHIFQSNGSDISNSMSINNLLYQVSFGYAANELMPIFGARRSNNNELKRFFSDYIRSRGALPSIRSGTQPYGILPASVYSRLNWDTDPNAGLYRSIFDYTSALDVHWTNAVASIEGFGARASSASPPSSSPTQQLSDVLSQHAISTEYVQRVGVGAGYVWNNLEYAAIKYPELRDQWNQQQMSRMEQIIGQLGLPLDYSHKAVQMNYLQEQSSVSIPLVADANTPQDAPLPNLGEARFNMLEVLYRANFDQLRDENFEQFGISDDVVDQQLRKNILYRFTRQSLMLEYYEAACELLGISEEDRKENEFINIVESSSSRTADTFAAAGPMGALSYGPSRLQLMATPFNGFATIGSFLSSGQAQDYPQARNLIEARSSLAQISRASVRDLTLLTAELVDAVSFRLDTWRLALVNQRLNALRGITEGSSSRTTGIYLGAYGWVTDVVRSTDLEPVPTPTQDGQFEDGIVHDRNNKGYIHAPSINQAVTGAVMLSGYTERANENMENPLSINLSSERVRAALDIMDGIRNGQNLSVLLGYEFERRLRDLYPDPYYADLFISRLRQHYPIDSFVVEVSPDPDIVDLIKARNVVNGTKLVEVYKTNGNDASGIISAIGASGADIADFIIKAIQWIWNLMDAVADIAMAEGTFHVVQGNPVKGGAIAEAISKGNLVAEPDIVNSIKSGLEVGQRFTMHFSASDPFELPNGWGDLGDESKRRNAEPYVNKWLTEILPAPVFILCDVIADGENVLTVSVEDLRLQPIDLLYMVGEQLNNDDSMLSLVIKNYIRQAYGYTKDITLEIVYGAPVDSSKFSFADVLPVLLYARKLITASRPLDTYDYMLPGDADGVLKLYNVDELNERITTARNALQTAISDLSNILAAPFDFTNFNNVLYGLSRFGIEQTVYEFVNDTSQEDEDILKAWGISVLSIAQARLDNSIPEALPAPGEDPVPFVSRAIECMKAIFGNAFVTLPLFGIRPEEQSYLSIMVNYSSSLRYDHTGNDLLTEEWLSSIARVRKNAANFEMLSILSSAIDFNSFYSRPILPLQLPYANDGTERWLGASVNSPEALKEGRVAIGASMLAGHLVSGDQVGILVDEWIDVIPVRDQTTGISFHHNQPNAKAPQCLLLGLTPQITGNWRWNDLVDMLNETFELAKKRGVDYEHISSSVVGQLPAMAIPFTQAGNVIGLSAAHVLSTNP